MRRYALVLPLACSIGLGCDTGPEPDPLLELEESKEWDEDDEDDAATGTDTGGGDDFPYPGDDGSDSGDDPPGGSGGGDSGGGDSGNGDSGGDDPPADDPCTSQSKNLIPQGFVHASSVYSTWLGGELYPAELSVDGDPTTSWFSNGPDADGDTSTYEWYVQKDHCIDTITILSNAQNAEPAFQSGYGFESMLVEVFDTSGGVVFEQQIDLTGTPDPDIELDLDGILAHRVLLSLSDHESLECGGFAELKIEGRERAQ